MSSKVLLALLCVLPVYIHFYYLFLDFDEIFAYIMVQNIGTRLTFSLTSSLVDREWALLNVTMWLYRDMA